MRKPGCARLVACTLGDYPTQKPTQKRPPTPKLPRFAHFSPLSRFLEYRLIFAGTLKNTRPRLIYSTKVRLRGIEPRQATGTFFGWPNPHDEPQWCRLLQKRPTLCSMYCGTCGCGGIGRRARLRIWCRKAWGFESLHPHKDTANTAGLTEPTSSCRKGKRGTIPSACPFPDAPLTCASFCDSKKCHPQVQTRLILHPNSIFNSSLLCQK